MTMTTFRVMTRSLILQQNHTLKICQTQYIENILRKYKLYDANSVGMPLDPHHKLESTNQPPGQNYDPNYGSLIGSLMYAAVATRPDLAYCVQRLSSFTHHPNLDHWMAAKRVLRYLSGTWSTGLVYTQSTTNPNIITAYADADFANSLDRRSISGYTFLINNTAITWNSKRQPTVALSTAEAEYSALASATREAIWLLNLISIIGFPP